MIFKLFSKSKDAIKLSIDSVLKIISGFVLFKIVSNSNDIALLANFSQVKMLTALFVSLSSSIFVIGINKLSIKYSNKDIRSSLLVLGLFLVILIGFGGYFYEERLENLVGRDFIGGSLYLFFFVLFGFLSNLLTGYCIKENNNNKLANGKLKSTALSMILFFILVVCRVDIWLSLLLYLLSYYIILFFMLYKKNVIFFPKEKITLKKELVIDFFKLYSLTVFSSLVFPSCIVYYRYFLSDTKSWSWVSVWEAEWQLSSVVLMILSPVLSIVFTSYFTNMYKSGGLTKNHVFKVLLTLSLFVISTYSLIYYFRVSLIHILFNKDMLLEVYNYSFASLLIVNFIRIISVALFYILYVVVDAKKLILSEIFFGGSFFLIMKADLGYSNTGSLELIIPVLVSFIYLFYTLLTSDFTNLNKKRGFDE